MVRDGALAAARDLAFAQRVPPRVDDLGMPQPLALHLASARALALGAIDARAAPIGRHALRVGAPRAPMEPNEAREGEDDGRHLRGWPSKKNCFAFEGERRPKMVAEHPIR